MLQYCSNNNCELIIIVVMLKRSPHPVLQSLFWSCFLHLKHVTRTRAELCAKFCQPHARTTPKKHDSSKNCGLSPFRNSYNWVIEVLFMQLYTFVLKINIAVMASRDSGVVLGWTGVKLHSTPFASVPSASMQKLDNP